MAVLTDRTGVVIERRFHWLADTWILGADVRGFSQSSNPPDPQVISEQLLSIAVHAGLPEPPGGHVPTPNPTWGLPPMPTATQVTCAVRFTDVSRDYWAFNYIQTLACAGIISGYNDGTFRPDSSTTRAQFAKMIVLARGWTPTSPDTPSFNDVGADNPFYGYIETAVSRGLVSGYGDGTFQPDAFVTRAQVAKILVLARGWHANPDLVVPLGDVTSSHWAWPYIQAALQHGVVTGYGDNNFRPNDDATPRGTN